METKSCSKWFIIRLFPHRAWRTPRVSPGTLAVFSGFFSVVHDPAISASELDLEQINKMSFVRHIYETIENAKKVSSLKYLSHYLPLGIKYLVVHVHAPAQR